MSGPVHIVLHIPKCAGTTVESHLMEHLGPQRFWAPGKRSRQFPLSWFRRKYTTADMPRETRVDAVSGHLIGRSVRRIFADRTLHHSVLMRDPEAMVLSWYNFRMGLYLSKGQSPYPFHLHLRALPPDPQLHFLLERWLELPWLRLAQMSTAEKLALLEPELNQFDRIGDISDVDDLIRELSESLGIPTEATARNSSKEWNDQTGWKPLRLSDLADDERAELRRRTMVDRYLWQRWALKDQDARPPADGASFLFCELARPRYELNRRLYRDFRGGTRA